MKTNEIQSQLISFCKLTHKVLLFITLKNINVESTYPQATRLPDGANAQAITLFDEYKLYLVAC